MTCTFKIGDLTVTAPAGIPCGGGVIVMKIIQTGINLLLLSAILLSFSFIITGGLKWMTSSGDKQKLQNAKKTITYAIIGLLISFLSFLIVQTIGIFFGVQLLNFNFP